MNLKERRLLECPGVMTSGLACLTLGVDHNWQNRLGEILAIKFKDTTVGAGTSPRTMMSIASSNHTSTSIGMIFLAVIGTLTFASSINAAHEFQGNVGCDQYCCVVC